MPNTTIIWHLILQNKLFTIIQKKTQCARKPDDHNAYANRCLRDRVSSGTIWPSRVKLDEMTFFQTPTSRPTIAHRTNAFATFWLHFVSAYGHYRWSHTSPCAKIVQPRPDQGCKEQFTPARNQLCMWNDVEIVALSIYVVVCGLT
jgi:hypothetical protein